MSDMDVELQRLESMRERVQSLRGKLKEIKDHLPLTAAKTAEDADERFDQPSSPAAKVCKPAKSKS